MSEESKSMIKGEESSAVEQLVEPTSSEVHKRVSDLLNSLTSTDSVLQGSSPCLTFFSDNNFYI